jgi:hypothetical protein
MEKNDNNLNEHLRRIKYFTDYKISESPKYRPLVGNNENFDQVPTLTNEQGEEELPAVEKPETPETPEIPANTNVGTNAPAPPADGGNTVPPPPPVNGGDMSSPNMTPTTGGMPGMNVNPPVDEIQNEIIKHNIEAMKSIHSELENLNNVVQGLNSQLKSLNAEVEEVREPSDTEKLLNKKQVSYPYYFNLNDMWSDNWFEKNRVSSNEKGIRELPDGSYIADFDDLPQKSKLDIQNSFNDEI